MSEAEFQAQVVELARLRGWRTHHHYDSRRSTPGWPDLVMVRRGRILVMELKVGNRPPTAAQNAWLVALSEAGISAAVYRPADWPQIETILE